MGDKRINFMHPTDGRIITVTLDETMTAAECIPELIANEFIAPHSMGYNLAIKGGPMLAADVPFADVPLRDGDTLRVVPATDAGGGIPGLDAGSITSYNLSDLRDSPAALTMVVRQYEDLEEQNRRLQAELEVVRLTSNNRLNASLILLISQVVISVGASLFPTDRAVGAVVIGAGILQALLATYLTFRRPSHRSIAVKNFDIRDGRTSAAPGEEPVVKR
jgi:hypothetical protein